VTTEHFTLQGARTAAITESTSRATIFIGSVSAGLVALGLIATATRIGTAFYAFGLILLSTLSLLGFVTLDRVLQSGIEELHYVERIARLRAAASSATRRAFLLTCRPPWAGWSARAPPTSSATATPPPARSSLASWIPRAPRAR
jgi:hypothetical protein